MAEKNNAPSRNLSLQVKDFQKADDQDKIVQDSKSQKIEKCRAMSQKRRDEENSLLQELFGLLPIQERSLTKQDKISLLRLVITYFRLKALYKCAPSGAQVAYEGTPHHPVPSKRN